MAKRKIEKIQVGFIGAGRIADMHYPGYKRNKEAALYAVADLDATIMEKRKKQWKLQKTYSDYHDLLADPEIDAVEILLPQKMHEKVTSEALRAGKHVALQKPMTVDIPSALSMKNEIDQYKDQLIFRVTDNYIFHPPVQFARQYIEEGKLGDVTNIRIRFISGSGGWEISPETWQWRLQERNEGRGLQTFDHGHHLWAIAWYLLGDFEKVFSWIDSVDGVIDSPSIINWKYKNSVCYGVCDYSHASELVIPSKYYANDESIEITGSKGILIIERITGQLNAGAIVRVFHGRGWEYFPDIKSDWQEGFSCATRNFIAAINGKEAPMLNFDDAMKILKINLSIAKSSMKAREVYLEEWDQPDSESFARKKIEESKKNAFFQVEEKESFIQRIWTIIANPFGPKEDYSDQAEELTDNLIHSFLPEKAENWNAVVNLNLTGEKVAIEYHIIISKGKISIEKGSMHKKPDLSIEISASDWAAILLKKKKIEMAYLQKKLRITEGKAEDALTLKSIFAL